MSRMSCDDSLEGFVGLVRVAARVHVASDVVGAGGGSGQRHVTRSWESWRDGAKDRRLKIHIRETANRSVQQGVAKSKKQEIERQK